MSDFLHQWIELINYLFIYYFIFWGPTFFCNSNCGYETKKITNMMDDFFNHPFLFFQLWDENIFSGCIVFWDYI
jgi:hypothetical protein